MRTSRLSHRVRPLGGPLMVGEKVQLVMSCRATRGSGVRRVAHVGEGRVRGEGRGEGRGGVRGVGRRVWGKGWVCVGVCGGVERGPPR